MSWRTSIGCSRDGAAAVHAAKSRPETSPDAGREKCILGWHENGYCVVEEMQAPERMCSPLALLC